MTKFLYIVKGATTGDNVFEHESESKESALEELEQIYAAKAHGLTLAILTKAEYDRENKRIQKEREDELNRVEE